MKRNFFRLLLSAVLMMCCMSTWALHGKRGGTYVDNYNTGGCYFDLYTDYSYTYEGVTTRSFSGKCAVVTGFKDYNNIVIPETITHANVTYTVVAIGEDAFSSSDQVGVLTVPSSVRVLEAFAFDSNEEKLTELVLADGSEDLFCYRSTNGNGAFTWNGGLKKVYIGRKLRYQNEEDNKRDYAPFFKGDFTDLKVTIGPLVTEIPNYCFYGKASYSSYGVSSVDFSQATSLQMIGKCAFYDNDLLKEVSLTAYRQSFTIEALAFEDCDSLTKVTLMGNTTSRLKYHVLAFAFSGCSSLETVIMDGVTDIDMYAFSSCEKLSNVIFLSNTSPKFGEHCFDTSSDNIHFYVKTDFLTGTYGAAYDFNGKLKSYPRNMMLRYQTTDGMVIADKVVDGGRANNYDIGCIYNSYETGEGIIYFDHELTSISPNSGSNWFIKCISLRSIVIPETVTYIGVGAFEFCNNLTDVFYLGSTNPTFLNSIFESAPVTIYVADTKNFDSQWGGHNVKSWRSGKGNGTKASPFEIENYVNLYGFSLEVQQGNYFICGKLTADIVANSDVLNGDGSLKAGAFRQWLPIGGWGNAYSGEFNGNDHTISGLYANSEISDRVALFGMTGKTGYPFDQVYGESAYIHDLGIKDSYFRGNSWAAGICGDFPRGRIENCWNSATVVGSGWAAYAGGISASCWTNASVAGCYNIGRVSVELSDKSACGGICGSVCKNPNIPYSVRYCVSLEGKCDVAFNNYEGKASVDAVYVKDAARFAGGNMCWLLNGNQRSAKWRQQLGKDPYPVLTGDYLVYLDGTQYHNETMCEKENGIHSFEKKVVTKCDKSTIVYWHCSACGKDFTDADRTKEETNANKSSHFPEYVMEIVPTETTEGRYGYYQCTKCHEKFKEELCSQAWTNDSELIVPKAKSNEIWYTSTNREKIDPIQPDHFGATIQTNEYEYGLGKITFDKDVTSIGESAFHGCGSLHSINIPSGVTSIGESAFSGCGSLHSINIPSGVTSIGDYALYYCSSLQSATIPNSVTSIGRDAFSCCKSLTTITFNSLPVLGIDAFYPCDNLNHGNRILDLTDSDKPYIGNKMKDYYPFTEVRYHRTLEANKLETIVLPFVPTAESIAGLEFYAYNTVSGGMIAFSKIEDIEAGVPYLVKNISDSKTEFTFTAATPKDIVLNTSGRSTNGFTIKGTFLSQVLNNTVSKRYYCLDGDQFKVISGEQGIDPFRAYLETENMSAANSLTISDYQIILQGDGTSDNPYRIGNGDELAMYAQIINSENSGACGILTADITVNTGILDNDGNLVSGKSFDVWTPMGGHGKDFSGEFNGNGHTISGLYFNDGSVNNVGLFGKAAGGAYIHDLGITDSYFYGKNHVAGICGDFASGKIENCWNGATVIGAEYDAGGISGSCWKYASIKDCFNVGNVYLSNTDNRYGGICGSVYSNTTVDYTIDNSYTLSGKCSRIRGLLIDGCPETKIHNSSAMKPGYFESGEVCWLLNGGSSVNVKWHQTLGDGGDKYPTLTGDDIVYLTARKCDGNAKALSNTKPESVTQDEHKMMSHDASASTCSTQGNIQHRRCTECGHLFKYDSDEELTEEQVLLALDQDNHNLSLNDGKAHCEWCKQDWEHYLAQDNKPVLLKAENDSYSLDKVELKYGHSYLCTDEVDVNNFSYTFPYYPNVWNSLFVPFEISTDELGVKGLGFTAAYIAGVRQYEKDASGDIITQVDVVKIKNGYLYAGTPYLIKQENSTIEPFVTFNKTGAKLKESSKVNNIHTETATAKYDFIGTYNTIAKENVNSNYYILGSEGTFVHPSSPVYAMNWYMKIEEKGAAYGQYSFQAKTIIINVIGEEDQTTGIRTLYPAESQVKEVYDLSGRRLDAPRKGQVNIINGKKILVK